MKRLILILITLSFVCPTISISVDKNAASIIGAGEGLIHFREGLNVVYSIINYLHADELQHHNGSTNLHIDSIKFYRQEGNVELSADSLNGKVDIVVITAGNTRIDKGKHSMTKNVSIYCIGYEILNKDYFIVKPYWEKIKFNIIPPKSLLGLIMQMTLQIPMFDIM